MMTMVDMVVDYYPDELSQKDMDDIEDAIYQVVLDPNSAEGCALRFHLVSILVNGIHSESKYISRWEYLLHSAAAFSDGWDRAMNLKGGQK